MSRMSTGSAGVSMAGSRFAPQVDGRGDGLQILKFQAMNAHARVDDL